MRLIVFNPCGRDPAQEFPDGAGRPDDPAASHPPVNFHAYAACTRGSFLTGLREVLRTEPARPVLLLGRRDLRGGLRALQGLKTAGRTVAFSFKETGALQVAEQLARPAAVELFLDIVRLSDACLVPTRALAALCRSAGARVVEMIPTPYPVEELAWDFSRTPPAGERRGVFVGTREFGAPARQHLAAVLLARRLSRETGEPATVVNAEGRRGAGMLAALGFSTRPDAPLRYLPGPLAYVDYLREMARHRLVLQLDRSAVPGQVAGDALLCRVPCLGGDGEIERLTALELAGIGHGSDEAVANLAGTLLRDPNRARTAAQHAGERALETVSFRAVAIRLAAFFGRLQTSAAG